MNRKHLGAAAVVLILTGWTLAQGNADPVKVKFEAGKSAAGQQVVNVVIDVAKSWHIYANPVDNEDLKAAETIVKVETKGVKADVKYPAGVELKDSILGKYKVYEGKITIPVVLQRGGEKGPVLLSVRYQACDDKKCLAPKVDKLTIP